MNEDNFKLLHDIRKVFIMLEDEIVQTMSRVASFDAAHYKVADPIKNVVVMTNMTNELRKREKSLMRWINRNADAEYQTWLTDNSLTDVPTTKYNL